MPPKSITYSISHAVDGLTHCLRTQRHMRIHFALAFGMMLLAIVLQVSGAQLLTLMFSLVLILVAEMFNTGIEVVVDLITTNYDPRAKIVKDVAAGAVLLSGLNAAIIALLAFLHSPVVESLRRRVPLPQYTTNWTELCVEALLILCLITLIWRIRGREGTAPRRNPVSARSAFAVFGMLVIIFSPSHEVRIIAGLCMLFLIVQGGSATRTYTFRQVAFGAVLGVLAPGLVLAAHYALARSGVTYGLRAVRQSAALEMRWKPGAAGASHASARPTGRGAGVQQHAGE